jgi:hypothetical protein
MLGLESYSRDLEESTPPVDLIGWSQLPDRLLKTLDHPKIQPDSIRLRVNQ